MTAYAEYLQSPHWQYVRKLALRRAGNRCQLCGSGGPLDVHHNTYERRGEELESDVIALCRPCHERHHGHERVVWSEPHDPGLDDLEWVVARLEQLGCRPFPREGCFASRCPVPAHRHHEPCLSVGRGDDGELLLYCLMGCSPDEILLALRPDPPRPSLRDMVHALLKERGPITHGEIKDALWTERRIHTTSRHLDRALESLPGVICSGEKRKLERAYRLADG